MRAVFLDFDGVLHPSGGPPGACLPFEWVDQLAALLAPYPDVRVVVHSSWRLQFGVDELRDFLGELGERPVDVVGMGGKAQAIAHYLLSHPEVQGSLVLDDQPGEFPAEFACPVLACKPLLGISDPAVKAQFAAWLCG